MPKYSTAFGMDVHLRSTTVCALDADTGEAVTRRFPGNLGARSPGGWMGSRAVARGLRERLPRLRPQRSSPGSASSASSPRSRRSPGRPPTRPPRTTGTTPPGWPKAILAHDISPHGSPPPRSRASGTSPAPTTGRPRAGDRQAAAARLPRKAGFVYGGTTPAGNPRKYWTYDFLRWLDKVRPEDDGGVRALAALRNEVEAAAEARADLLSEYRAAVDASPIAAEVAALQSIKGLRLRAGRSLSAEVGDFTRFRSGRQVTAYFGLAPSQRSSGDSVRLGGISGAGNALVRKLAVEGSWCYAAARHQPKLMPRDTGVPLEIRMHGRKGSERLLRRREEMLARGMPAAKANAATAAELVRWLWALGTMCREGAE